MKNSNFSTKKLLKGTVFSTILLFSLSCSNESVTGSSEEEIINPSEISDLQSSSKTTNTTAYKVHDFDDNSLGPFTEDQGFTGSDIYNEGMSFQNDFVGGKRLKLTWKESEYDGTRRERGHEIKLGVNDNKEIYSGFYLFIPSGQSNNLLNKNTIIWQLYNWNSAGCSNWTAHLVLKNNDLYLDYRSACVAATEVKILDNIDTDVELAFQIRCVLSGNNNGRITVLMDDTTLINETNINLGFGSFDSNDEAETSVAGVKMGLYCYDTSNYTDNETRIIYLENVASSLRSGSVQNSLNKVKPANNY
ncbi:hypothetical protein AXE80_05425 [Wenyingzhuangia fucanilytica]|uniref:Alginate lyase 2 domain-containing protein n=1 Tax=Wenyingzhuangia fucanilytica TaxID=1790137 RepID=A0A1B1Y4Q1_9FLAO|nr:hypothetical protein [Wenyingzhuangia fucanilytica]ANW95752.1 hypothetical protein AXE80_05425 [Wenyingzhuangia fucanilytica]